MKYLQPYKLFENVDLLDKFKTYRFDNKIKQNKDAIIQNAVNVKEVIHIACEWCKDLSGHIFMFEIAMIETGLGVSSKSRATRGDIGRSIWHVDKGTFEWSQQAHPRINNALKNLKAKGLDWSQVQWNDISENILLGAIACKLVLLKKGLSYGNSQNLSSQQKRAKIYATKYNAGGTAEAEKNYLRNIIGWYKTLIKYGGEYLKFRGKKFQITEKGLMLNNKIY